MKKVFTMNAVSTNKVRKGCFSTLKKTYEYLHGEFGASLKMLSKKANYSNMLADINEVGMVHLMGEEKGKQVTIDIIFYQMNDVVVL